MTRRLAYLGLCLSLGVAVTASFALAQRPGRTGSVSKTTAAKQPARQEHPGDVLRVSDLQQDLCQDTNRPDEKDKEKRGDARHGGDGPSPRDNQHPGSQRSSGPRSRGPSHADARGHMERRFIHDAVRRSGGPLELLPLLSLPETREELKRANPSFDDEAFQAECDAYMTDMQKRIDEDRKQADAAPRSRLGKMFAENLARENEHFQAFFDGLPQWQQDQLIYLFIQARNYRALSNHLVEHRLGLSSEEASNIREDIEEIREQTMDETRDRFRRIFDKGGGRDEFEKMVRENQRRMDARIEKKLTEEQRAKFTELRSKTAAKAPDWLVRGIDFPPPPRPKDLPPRKPLED